MQFFEDNKRTNNSFHFIIFDLLKYKQGNKSLISLHEYF